MKNFLFRAGAITGMALTVAGSAAAQSGYGMDGYHRHMWDDGYGFFGGGIMLLIWLAIIVVIVFAVKWLVDRDGPKSKSFSALDALKMRFAKGEIDAEEYEARRKILED